MLYAFRSHALRCSTLPAVEREQFLALPQSLEEFIRQYPFMAPVLPAFVATQLKLTVPDWVVDGQREQTRRDSDYHFAPHIRDLSDTKLYVPPGSPAY